MVTTIGYDGCAFDIDGGCTHCILQYNYSHDNEGSGFQSGPFAGCSPLGDNTIRYNISQNDAKKNTGNTGGIMTWGSQPRGQIYNNTVFAGRGLKSNPAAFRGGDGFAVRNNIFVVDHDGDIIIAGGGTFQNNCYWRTNGDLRLAGHADLAAWRKASGQERLDGADVGFQVDPRFRAPGGGGNIDDAARLGTLRAYDLLPVLAAAGQGPRLAEALPDRAGPVRLPRHALAAGDEVQPRRQPRISLAARNRKRGGRRKEATVARPTREKGVLESPDSSPNVNHACS